MKRVSVLLALFLTGTALQAMAQSRPQLTEPEQLGTLAGVATACNAGVALHDFEEIAARLIANKAANDVVEDYQVKSYATAKAVALKNQLDNPDMNCASFVTQFMQMPVFRFELYEDGALKTDTGTYLLPRGKTQFDPNVKRRYPRNGQALPVAKAAASASVAQVQEPVSDVGQMVPVANKMQPVQNRMRPVVNRMRPVSNNR